MKVVMLVACLAAACVGAARAEVSGSALTFAPTTVVCWLPDVQVSMGPYAGGIFSATATSQLLLTASQAGITFDRRRCKRVRTGKLPRPYVPQPNFTTRLGADADCTTNPNVRNVAVVIHAHFVKSAGRVFRIYGSVRIRRTGRFIAAGLISVRGSARVFWGSTCVIR